MVNHSLARHVTWHSPPIENQVRLWTYIASRPLSSDQVDRANLILAAFVKRKFKIKSKEAIYENGFVKFKGKSLRFNSNRN